MIRINLLPASPADKLRPIIMELTAIVVLLAMAGGGGFVWSMYYQQEIDQQLQKVSEHKDEIARLKKIIGEVNKLEEQREALKKQLAVIEKLERGKRGPVRVLDELSTHIPKRVWINGFRETNGNLQMDGVGLENADISEFMRALQKSKYFDNVKLGFTQAAQKNGVQIFTFQVTCTVNYAA